MAPAPQNRRLELLRRWAVLLDSAFRVPGTRLRFGLDAIVGLFPGLGDLATPVFGVLLILQAFHMRLPRVVRARVVLNSALDVVLGLVPVLGDIADIGFKANLRNLALLERHARPGVPPARGDYIFVILFVIVLVFVILAPIVLIVWLLSRFRLV